MKTKPTSEQLVDMLEDKLDITICADVVHGLDLEYKELQERINKSIDFIEEHNKKAGKLYYKYNNKYLLSEIKEDLLEILKGEIK